ncbi:DUF3427 domain-containing protein [Cyanobium sp. AMD-g]|uniref:DUF3427 domain-containing protein n=1 Tax=Cyanobium sp. AMD-g TaxID=2823699 RepID=UPI0020CC2CCB|nr:DUF3427 domain-containing protein [Cyanobium sp. AMD-g]
MPLTVAGISTQRYSPQAAADLRAELVELFALLHERTDHLVTPLDWDRADPPPIPLKLHGRYSRAEVFAAFGLLNEARPFPGREGVFFDEATQCDVFFITLKKSERLFSPTTRHNDVAISPWEFHWESQSLTREASATGQRYIHHVVRGSRVMLFVREENKRGGVTLPFLCLGFADYVSHEGRAADGDSLETAQGDSGGVRAGVGVGGVRGGTTLSGKAPGQPLPAGHYQASRCRSATWAKA